jgi:cyclophilin family peptidyl-prolyl cis-trans isomerase
MNYRNLGLTAYPDKNMMAQKLSLHVLNAYSVVKLFVMPLLFVSAAFLLATDSQAETTHEKTHEKAAPSTSEVIITTDLGSFRVQLYPQKAPVTVDNFLHYAESGFYIGTIFHRVIPGFVAQGGGYTFDFVKKKVRSSIKNESTNGLSNIVATLAMARLPHPDTATSQFYINLADNTNLDAKPNSPGYTVFGKVIEGMDVIDLIAAQPTGQFKPQAPDTPIRILSIKAINTP